MDSRSSASIADIFASFEAHHKLILLSIAALHRIELPEKSTTNQIRMFLADEDLSVGVRGLASFVFRLGPCLGVELDGESPRQFSGQIKRRAFGKGNPNPCEEHSGRAVRDTNTVTVRGGIC